MQILFLSCWRATYFSSIKTFKKLSLPHRVQLWLHLNMCKDCHEFDQQSKLIDDSISHFQKFEPANYAETLSEEKKSSIKTAVNQAIK